MRVRYSLQCRATKTLATKCKCACSPEPTLLALTKFGMIRVPDENRGSYMSAHVLLNLLNELGKRDKMRGLPSILSLFRNEFNKFNNTRARMLDSIHHMTLRLL